MVIDISYARYMQSAYVIMLTVLSIITYNKWQPYNSTRLLQGNNTSNGLLFFFVLIVAVILGSRPADGFYFGDTSNYARAYECYRVGITQYDPSESEWLFNLAQAKCATVMRVEWFFTIVSLGYFLLMLFACKRMFGNNSWGAMLFLLSAFSTFSYATNGIRNGLACSMILFALSFAVKQRKDIVIAIFISVFAIAIHKSTALPVVCFTAAYFLRSTKGAIYFWIFSILLSIIAHGPIENFFSGLGFDDRLTSYTQGAEEYAETFKSGFRPDFLLYSAMPIWLAYHVLVKKGIQDRTYSLIANTYIYCNSFWVMMMQAAYSNRFAYLSWFMLPLVLAYPCLRMNVWGKRQGQVAANIMLAHTAFTFFMTMIYY